ncbi:hypothetical protein [Nonomuraea sp. NEAU-A123]|uniref:hypothetical protein n=1 Tax=Nonomuraea sp. NEAU-A123 TaxID=2839649 RepID=UPI001BE48AEE|nr:hypothetical protein [Nonomuraea sp. NEAU-A123]MBT2228401.1 hypothetical protein [Nonomuraea sp. NEAU-A123]
MNSPAWLWPPFSEPLRLRLPLQRPDTAPRPVTRRADRERSAHEELLAQLALLDAQLRKVADAIHRGDEQALRDQGRFLRDRFGGSDLDLD